jgi:hypothetical protein
MDIFGVGQSILINTFCACAGGFQSFSRASHYALQFNIVYASSKLLTHENA